MADVFISYARTSFDTANSIAEALRSHGFSVWFDEEILANRAYADVIAEQLEAAKAILVLWSADAASSHWVRSEANRARENGTLVQVRLDEARLPLPFDQIQCLDFRGWLESKRPASWERLIGTIESQAGGHAHPGSAQITTAKARHLAIARRPLLAGAAVVAAFGAAAFLGWREFTDTESSPEVELLIQKAMASMQDSRPEELGQAMAYLLEAIRRAPQHPRAWGLLSFTYAQRKYLVPVAARSGEEARCRSAARTALELESDEPFASCALAMLVSPYRNWRRAESLGRDLTRRFAFLPLPHNLLADALADVGLWQEAVEVHSRVDRKSYIIPLSDRSFIQALWSAGNLQRAETMLAEAVERWPLHEAIWNFRIRFLTHSGRADEAVGLLENRAVHPVGLSEQLRRSSLLTAKAIAGSIGRDGAIRANLDMLDDAPADYLIYLNRKLTLAQLVAQRCAALGDGDSAFALLDGYYFGRGPWAKLAPLAGDEDRTTVNLFEPPMSGLWRDPRFSALVRRIGLESYWRTTDRRPDYQRH